MCEQSGGKNDNTFTTVTDFENRLLKEIIFWKKFFMKEENVGLHSEQCGPFILITLQVRQH